MHHIGMNGFDASSTPLFEKPDRSRVGPEAGEIAPARRIFSDADGWPKRSDRNERRRRPSALSGFSHGHSEPTINRGASTTDGATLGRCGCRTCVPNCVSRATAWRAPIRKRGLLHSPVHKLTKLFANLFHSRDGINALTRTSGYKDHHRSRKSLATGSAFERGVSEKSPCLTPLCSP